VQQWTGGRPPVALTSDGGRHKHFRCWR